MSRAQTLPGFQPWQQAWQQALYGERGFYRQPGGPATHFRTSVHAGDVLAAALADLAARCGLRRVVDVGSGRGELLRALQAVDPGLELVGADVVPRPDTLRADIGWVVCPGGAALSDELHPWLAGALVVAHEWLDDVPCPVGCWDGRTWRLLEVSADGTERPGGTASPDDLGWLHRWWPSAEPGDRAEVGLPRDQAWAGLVRAAPGSVLLAVDYSHQRDSRPPDGTLVGYRDGTACPPVPDGSCDLTAHVALDAVQAAGEAAGAAPGSLLTTQRTALRALGVRGQLPDARAAAADPSAYLAALSRASLEGELLDPVGLGGFGWLLQSTGPALPALTGRTGVGELDTAARERQA